MRAAIYARYSSDNQREASIEDQIRVCRTLIERAGWQVGEIYSDAAISGATTLRPGYQKLLEDARGRRFGLVVAEGLDRLSRDQEDIAGLFKQLRFNDVALHTVAEGEITELHVGLKGTMNALFLKDLAAKSLRGQIGRAVAGMAAGYAFGDGVFTRQFDVDETETRSLLAGTGIDDGFTTNHAGLIAAGGLGGSALIAGLTGMSPAVPAAAARPASRAWSIRCGRWDVA